MNDDNNDSHVQSDLLIQLTFQIRSVMHVSQSVLVAFIPHRSSKEFKLFDCRRG